jgi:hypothetical protein
VQIVPTKAPTVTMAVIESLSLDPQMKHVIGCSLSLNPQPSSHFDYFAGLLHASLACKYNLKLSKLKNGGFAVAWDYLV